MQLLVRLGGGSNEGPQHWKGIVCCSTKNVQVSRTEACNEKPLPIPGVHR